MNKKNVFYRFAALLLAVLLLSACSPTPSDPNETTAFSSDTQPPKPSVNASGFAERLAETLEQQTLFDIDFDIREKHDYAPGSSMEKAMFVRLEADFSNSENLHFLYSMKRNPAAEEPEILLFYDKGYFYVKDINSLYKQPASLTQATNGLPFEPLTVLFADDLKEIFGKAALSEHADGSLTATVETPVSYFSENVGPFLQIFGIEQEGSAENIYGSIRADARMNTDTILSYTVVIETEIIRRDGTSYPVKYTVKAEYEPIGENFAPALPDADARLSYMEAEPEISEITASAFAARFEKSDAVADRALYTQMTTNAVATYFFSENSVSVPLLNVTAIDLSKPRSPKVSVIETKNMFGTVSKTEIYYKDGVYYYALDGKRFSIPYPEEEYLANVEASAKEKEEAGITSMFLTADMLEGAVFTVHPDQAVTAFIRFNGETQRKNIFYNIKSLYNDEFSEMQDVSISESKVSVTLDRFNRLLSYTLETAVSATSNGMPAVLKYAIQYSFVYSETPREVDFPDDLNTQNYPNAAENGLAGNL